MKFRRYILLLCTVGALSFPMKTQAQGITEVSPQNSPSPTSEYEKEEKDSGWFIGSDQGVLFFVGNSSHLVGTQYYGTLFGGYTVKGIFQPMVRIGQAIGTLNGFFDPTTFFFIMEGGFEVTPLRTMISPYFRGTSGFYVLSFDDFGGPPVQTDTNFTYSGGGGVKVKFGSSRLTIGSAYRGFINSGINLQSVEVTLGYTFQF
jgi:hypothetical protein